MNPEHKKAINNFIDERFLLAQKKLRDGLFQPQVFFFFHYPNDLNRPFGNIPLPNVQFFFIQPLKQGLKEYIRHAYAAMQLYVPQVKKIAPGYTDPHLIAVILVDDCYITSMTAPNTIPVNVAIEASIRPSEDPTRKTALYINAYIEGGSFGYYFPYSSRGKNIKFNKERIELSTMIGGTFQDLFPK